MDDQLSTPSFSSEPRNVQGEKRPNDSESCLVFDMSTPELLFITHIHVTDVVVGLRRMPASPGLYVMVEVEGKTTKTSNKPTSLGRDVAEWDEETLLPSEQSSFVSIKIYASFEHGLRLGNGELLRQFKTTVGIVLDLNERLQAITFQDNEFLSSCSSVRIVTEKRACAFKKSAIGFGMSLSSEFDTMSQLAQLTDMGHDTLLRYHQRPNKKDLDEAIICFERAWDMSTFDDPCLSSALFNLATAKLIRCRVTNDVSDLDAAIALYRDALLLRSPDHLDHCATALALSFTLLARFHQQRDNPDKKEAGHLLARVVIFSPPDYYAHRAASFALRMVEVPVLFQMNGISQTDCRNDEDMQKAMTALKNTSDKNPRRASLLADLGNLLHRRFKESGNVADADDAIRMFESALKLTPDEHPDKPGWMHNLGSSLCQRFQRRGDLSDLNRAVSVSENAIHFTSNNDPDRPPRLNVLGILLSMRFQQLGDLKDLTNSVSLFEEAVRIASDDNSNKPGYLMNLSNSLSYRFERHGNPADINKSISLKEEALNIIPDGHAQKLLLLNNLGDSLLRRFERFGDLTDINRSISVNEEAASLTPDGHPSKPIRLDNLGNSLKSRFKRLGNLEDIKESILVREEAVRLTPDGHLNKPTFLNGLGNSLFSRFEHLGDLTDINKSISMHEQAVSLASDSHPEKRICLSSLASSLLFRFQRLGDIADIDRSVSANKDAVQLTPDDHPNKPTMLTKLGSSFMGRFVRVGDLADLNRSILVRKEAVRLTPDDHPIKPALSADLASSLILRFERLGDLADIDIAISMFEECVQLSSNDDPTLLNNFGLSLIYRFRRLGDLTDINKSISAFEKALQLIPNGHSKKPILMDSLASALSCRFEHFGDSGDITKAILMTREAETLTPVGHPVRPTLLTNLGILLNYNFSHMGDIADLNEAILVQEEAVHLTPNGYPSKQIRLANLGSSLNLRFQHVYNLADINKSILAREEAILLTPDGHPSKPARLSGLGNSLFCRFEWLGDLADINKSVSINRQAVSLTPNDHPEKPNWLSNLGISLYHRFEHLCDIEDINESISVHEQSITLIPDSHPTRAAMMNNLGVSLMSRFTRLGDLTDINRSIIMKEEAFRLTPDSNPSKPAWLSNFGNSLFHRFQQSGDIADINKSISLQEQAVFLTPDGHPNKLLWMNNLGSALMERFKHSHDPLDLSAAALHFSVVSRASTCSVFIRFFAVLGLTASAQLKGDLQALLEAYSTTIDLLPQLAWLGLPVAERHRILLEVAGVARDAAAAALEAHRSETAVEWLEQGRSIVWSQFLQLRTPVDELRVAHPALADQFQQISRELEHASRRDNGITQRLENGPSTDALSLEREVQRHHDLTLEREKLLDQIRSLPGLERFLLPRTIEQLVSSATTGPVVYLNASQKRCDAMIVRAMLRGVTTVTLSGVSLTDVGCVQTLLRFLLMHNRLIPRDDISALMRSEVGHASEGWLDTLLEGDSVIEGDDRGAKVKPQRIKGYAPEDIFRLVLAYLWNKIVRPILRVLGFSTPPPSGSAKLTRVFWCSTGPFSFLPIHAAGLYGSAEAPGTKLSDFAISSYIPTLGALLEPAVYPSSSSPIQIVAVSQPPTDGLAALSSVKQEIDHIRTLSARSPFVTLQDSHGTVEDVMEKMKNADWVHFACHGVQDQHDPLDSGLCLANKRRLKLSDIIHLARPQGGLAFLSACQTAQGDEKLSEESVHLAAGMLLAGYGGVIATMWSIKDPDAPKVTEKVYEHLFRDGKVPDSMEAAEALHYAIQHLRDSGAPFSSWVPFIHVGM